MTGGTMRLKVRLQKREGFTRYGCRPKMGTSVKGISKNSGTDSSEREG